MASKEEQQQSDVDCVICATSLTIDNIVNTKCHHKCCNHCFWKWAENSNQCPFCRKEMIENPERGQYLQLGKDIQRRRAACQLLRDECNMLRDMCTNKSVELVQMGIECDSCRYELCQIQEAYKELQTRIEQARYEDNQLDQDIIQKQDIYNQIQLWRRDPLKAMALFKKRRHQQQHADRRRVMRKLRHCFMDLEMLENAFDHRHDAPMPYALISKRAERVIYNILWKWSGKLIRASNCKREEEIYEEDMHIAHLWLDEEERALRKNSIHQIADEAVNAYFYLAHCSCAATIKEKAISGTGVGPPSTSPPLSSRYAALMKRVQVHLQMAASRAERAGGIQCVRSYRVKNIFSRFYKPMTQCMGVPPLSRRLVGGGGGGGGASGGDDDYEDMPALEPLDVDPSATVVDAELIRAAHLLQQFMDNGYINEDIDEVSFQLSNANAIVFQRMDT